MVARNQNDVLIARFTHEEIKFVLKMLGKNKAPGLDGFTAEFCLQYWDHFKKNFMKLFEEFYANGRPNSCVKENFIFVIQIF